MILFRDDGFTCNIAGKADPPFNFCRNNGVYYFYLCFECMRSIVSRKWFNIFVSCDCE